MEKKKAGERNLMRESKQQSLYWNCWCDRTRDAKIKKNQRTFCQSEAINTTRKTLKKTIRQQRQQQLHEDDDQWSSPLLKGRESHSTEILKLLGSGSTRFYFAAGVRANATVLSGCTFSDLLFRLSNTQGVVAGLLLPHPTSMHSFL